MKKTQLAQAEKKLEDAKLVLERVQQDINWMLNNRKFLNASTFDYLETMIEGLDD